MIKTVYLLAVIFPREINRTYTKPIYEQKLNLYTPDYPLSFSVSKIVKYIHIVKYEKYSKMQINLVSF